MKMYPLLLLAALLIPGVATAHSCPSLMAEYDAALAANSDLDDANIIDEDSGKSAKALREEGATLHQSGSHDESVAALEKALELISSD